MQLILTADDLADQDYAVALVTAVSGALARSSSGAQKGTSPSERAARRLRIVSRTEAWDVLLTALAKHGQTTLEQAAEGTRYSGMGLSIAIGSALTHAQVHPRQLPVEYWGGKGANREVIISEDVRLALAQLMFSKR